MIDRYPDVAIRCAETADVVQAVRFANEHDLAIAVRGGGHNIAGNAVGDGGLLIDLSPMKIVQVDAQKRTASVGPGATLADVDKETQAFALALPTGINSTTGIAGSSRAASLLRADRSPVRECQRAAEGLPRGSLEGFR
jgi:FAD/FMN-containing dehydrogenase